MKALIVYDSFFGNTDKIARKIHEFFGMQEDIKLCKISDFKAEYIKGVELLIVGSPTRGFRPTEPISAFIKKMPATYLEGIYTAAFDTRLSIPDLKSPFLRYIVKNGGYAAGTISDRMQKKGGLPIISPEGFLVSGEQGPLKEGELQRASIWIEKVVNKFQKYPYVSFYR
ncbi:MAG: flavodoxin family protein [Bacteroidales bacterium]|nr:flavodoxin family protein [Bacteroidales bacterium]